jgi:hypothetical protein
MQFLYWLADRIPTQLLIRRHGITRYCAAVDLVCSRGAGAIAVIVL